MSYPTKLQKQHIVYIKKPQHLKNYFSNLNGILQKWKKTTDLKS